MIRRSVGKLDGMASCLGRPLYVEDFVPLNALRLKIVQSPHAFVRIEKIDIARALEIPGVVCVLTYEDVPQDNPIILSPREATSAASAPQVIV